MKVTLSSNDKEPITKTFKITTSPRLMRTFERFLAFFHYNAGHSGTFAMEFDGDGSDTLKVDPAPNKDYGKEVSLIGGVGFEVELARPDAYSGRFTDGKEHSFYEAKGGKLYKDDEAIK